MALDEWQLPKLDDRPIRTCIVCDYEGIDDVSLVQICEYPGGPVTSMGNVCYPCLDKWDDAQSSGDYTDFI
jgi:hypothetical protein